jgi:hypothetical protein
LVATAKEDRLSLSSTKTSQSLRLRLHAGVEAVDPLVRMVEPATLAGDSWRAWRVLLIAAP